MISDLMTLMGNLLEEVRVMLRLGAEHEEGGWCVFLPQDLEDLWRPGGIRTVIKSQSHLVRPRIPLSRDALGHRELRVLLGEIALRSNNDAPLPIAGGLADINEITTPRGGNQFIERDFGEQRELLGIKSFERIHPKNIPDGRILLSESIEGNATGVVGGYGAPFIVESNSIKEVDFMLLILRGASQIIEIGRVLSALDTGVRLHPRLRGPRYRIGEPDLLHRLGVLPPVISVRAKADHPLGRIAVDHHGFQPTLKPITAGNRTRLIGFRVFIVEGGD